MLSNLNKPYYECSRITMTISWTTKVVKYQFSRLSRESWKLTIHDNGVETHNEDDTWEEHLEYVTDLMKAYRTKLGTCINQSIVYGTQDSK